MNLSFLSCLAAVACLSAPWNLFSVAAAEKPPVSDLPGLRWTNQFFPGTTYTSTVPTVESLLGFGIGDRAATSAEISRCLNAWVAAAPDRTRLVEYARTYENRPLHYVVVTSPANLARVEAVQAGYARLADPRGLDSSEAKRLVDTLPPVAWLAYTIHGDETEGSDAALALIYHLLAASDPATEKLRQDVIIIIDPLMNPDGRERFLEMVAQNRGAQPNVDDQALLHAGRWPWGRGNHYLFDLNRDAAYAVHPETRGRMREVSRWHPVLYVDAHGMGPQDTHLFSPPREPYHPQVTEARRRWAGVFVRDQAAAFDRQGLVYYSGEWNDGWYPGYTDEWAALRGVVGILYEQARVAEDGVRRAGGRILSYRESVFHHVVGSMANLTTLQAHGRELVEEFLRTRQAAVDPQGGYAGRTWAILPSANQGRLDELVSLLRLQGFELREAGAEFTAPTATNQLGQALRDVKIPAGTVLVSSRQPLAHLAAALLDFDPPMPAIALEEERRELLRKGTSRMYDITAWNLTMYYGLDTLVLGMEPPGSARLLATSVPPVPKPAALERPVAWVFEGADDRSVAAAARLLERGVHVRVAKKDSRLDGRTFARGSALVFALDNRTATVPCQEALDRVGQELGLFPVPLRSGLGEGDLPDLGGEHFPRLEPPRIALLGGDATDFTDYGAAWFLLDRVLGVRHSALRQDGKPDLSRYNVVIVPEQYGGKLDEDITASLKEWVRQGGTLIAMGSGSASFLTPGTNKSDFLRLKTLPDVLDRLPEYELAVFREWLGLAGPMPDLAQVWNHRAPTELKYPWSMVDGPHQDEKELKRRDAWQSVFMPQGAMLAGRVDTNHWLTCGASTPLPLLVGGQPVLMAATGVEAPVRYGVFVPADKDKPDTNAPAAKLDDKSAAVVSGSKQGKGGDKEKPEPPRAGWAGLPPGQDLQLRMSGLLWPEATHRLANAAWLTREGVGRGQVIIFASPPAFRGATRGPTRLLLNAVVYGPGCGTNPVLVP